MPDPQSRPIKYARIIFIATFILTTLGIIHWKLQSLGAMIYGFLLPGYVLQMEFRERGRITVESIGLVLTCVALTVFSTCLTTLLVCNTLYWLLNWRSSYCSADLVGVAFNLVWFSCLFVIIMTWLWCKKNKE